jgi:hypothetical protein
MKPLHWDAINPFTGRPFTFDVPNLKFVDGKGVYLEPGDPGFVPYDSPAPAPAPKKRKPFRRRRPASVNENTHLEHKTMSGFHYNVGPNSGGGFTARPVRLAQVDSTALLNAVAAQAAVTPEQSEAVLRAFIARITAHAADSEWSANFLDLLTFRGTCGGNAAAPDDFHNAADINAGVAIAILAPVIEAWQQGITLVSEGERGKVTPDIASIIRQSDEAVDKYTPGGLIQVRGEHLNFDRSDLTQGVFFTAGAAAEVRATEYAVILPQSVVVLVPGTLSGDLSVRVASFINGSVRSVTYTNLIKTA